MRLARVAWVSVVVAAAWACSEYEGEDGPVQTSDAGLDASPAASDAGRETEPLDAGGIADREAPRAFLYAFVTKADHDGKFDPSDGFAGADAFCSNATLGTSLKGLQWHALLGNNATNARDRIADGGAIPHEYRLITGETVFQAGYRFVSGPLVPLHDVDRDENGNLVDFEVWTGSKDDGTKFGDNFTCNGWTYNGGGNVLGETGFTKSGDQGPTKDWLAAAFRECAPNGRHHLYCFEVGE